MAEEAEHVVSPSPLSRRSFSLWIFFRVPCQTPQAFLRSGHNRKRSCQLLFGGYDGPAPGLAASPAAAVPTVAKIPAPIIAPIPSIKILVLLFFIVVALYFVSPSTMAKNWQPFQPNGWGGTLAGAAVVFFAYIGFDAVSTVAEETKNPARDLPIGIIASLIICTIFYVVVAAVFTGMIPYQELVTRLLTEQAEPLTMALDHVAPQATWASGIVAFGSVVAHTAVLLVFQLGQPRIFFSMARDGLLPPVFASVHPKFKPARSRIDNRRPRFRSTEA